MKLAARAGLIIPLAVSFVMALTILTANVSDCIFYIVLHRVEIVVDLGRLGFCPHAERVRFADGVRVNRIFE